MGRTKSLREETTVKPHHRQKGDITIGYSARSGHVVASFYVCRDQRRDFVNRVMNLIYILCIL
jgi:hypothetical protein